MEWASTRGCRQASTLGNLDAECQDQPGMRLARVGPGWCQHLWGETTMTANDRPPLVSVVVPTYKRTAMLREALGSVLGQTLRDLEVIVCDNADDPETREVVASFDDDRITYVGRPENIGMMANAIDGFRRATGELVIKLDDDDAFEPDALETLAAPFADRPELTASFCDLQLVDVAGHELAEATTTLQHDTHRESLPEGLHTPFSAIAAQGAVTLAGALLRRSAIDWDAVPAQAGTSYDLFLVVSAAEDAASSWYVRRPLVRYRIHGANDSVKNVVPSLEASQWILREAMASGRHGDAEVFRQRMAQDDARLAREYLLLGDGRRARRSALDSLRVRPTPAAISVALLSMLPLGMGTRVSRRRREAYVVAAGRRVDAAPAPTTDH
ncbi:MULTISPECIES: glycosyltransferase family 2 protein [Arsenicicoccus]|uniref:glycosyltransferase family 2 protein n=1 Tax=Arsenicicoccus TaxID=267408 RepID=UPI00257960C8|nr:MULTISPECIES: glycosyltransferase family 2 protein [Arsenicicoccus]